MKLVYDNPTATFPHKIPRRLNLMSVPRKHFMDTGEGMPAYTPYGTRKSALRGPVNDRVNDAAWPYLRRLLLIKRMYRNRFSTQRLEKIDRMIEAANSTMYSKLANCTIDLKKGDSKDTKKKKGWGESDWKKHMDHISQIAGPKPDLIPKTVDRGPRIPLAELLPRLEILCIRPEFKVYKRLSQQSWYRDPEKVSPKALKYVISERIKMIAAPKAMLSHD